MTEEAEEPKYTKEAMTQMAKNKNKKPTLAKDDSLPETYPPSITRKEGNVTEDVDLPYLFQVVQEQSLSEHPIGRTKLPDNYFLDHYQYFLVHTLVIGQLQN